ncbi:unnamed protein product [Gongylonema pulchrum]|uniref:Vesicle transport protein n=1 Tax=Gongylonema pulchrum TaxID=637853 RepID=A0A183E946_9BILA|nr:unnamed protein product [Gongylonema pulchrum]
MSIRSKITSGLNGFSTVLSPGSDSDREALTESAEPVNGQLPSTRNRKNNGWFSSVSGEETLFGMSRMQRITAFFMSITAAFLCFGTAVILLPTIVIQARKFAALNTLGSVMLILRFVLSFLLLGYIFLCLHLKLRHNLSLFNTSFFEVNILIKAALYRGEVEENAVENYMLSATKN